jgi:hypothetical protein
VLTENGVNVEQLDLILESAKELISQISDSIIKIQTAKEPNEVIQPFLCLMGAVAGSNDYARRIIDAVDANKTSAELCAALLKVAT